VWRRCTYLLIKKRGIKDSEGNFSLSHGLFVYDEQGRIFITFFSFAAAASSIFTPSHFIIERIIQHIYASLCVCVRSLCSKQEMREKQISI
jgi:hypothetical protein